MASIETLRQARQAAGEAYAAAAEAYAAAWSELLAYDLTIGNTHVSPAEFVRFDQEPPHISRHPLFFPVTHLPHQLNAAAHKRHEALLAEVMARNI